MLINLILSFAVGFLLHQTRRQTSVFPHGWRDLVHYSVGVFGTFPLFLLWMRKRVSQTDRAGIAFLMSFLGVGSGVAAGWLVDTFMGANDETD